MATLAETGSGYDLEVKACAEALQSAQKRTRIAFFLALAACYCNDIYREARKRGIEVEAVEVDVTGHFGNEGEPASEISYSAAVSAKAPR